MSIHGRDPRIWYDQTKCCVDVFLRDLKGAGKLGFWLETCNVHAAAMAVEAVGAQFKYQIPTGPDGRPLLSQAGLMFCVLYGRYGQANAPHVVEGAAENEDARNIAWVLERCANVRATYVETTTPVEDAVDALGCGSSVVLSYLTAYGSGHYVALTDMDGDKVVVFDSWAGNKHCSHGGVAERYEQSFFESRARPRIVVVTCL